MSTYRYKATDLAILLQVVTGLELAVLAVYPQSVMILDAELAVYLQEKDGSKYRASSLPAGNDGSRYRAKSAFARYNGVLSGLAVWI